MHLCCCLFVVIHVEFTWTAIFMHFGIKQSTILHQVMIVFIETLSLHVIFILILLCRTKNKGNKRSLWRRGMLKLPPSCSLSKLNLLHQFLLACYCSIWNYSCTVCFQLLLSAYKRENPFPSLRRDLHEGKWLRMFFIFILFFLQELCINIYMSPFRSQNWRPVKQRIPWEV